MSAISGWTPQTRRDETAAELSLLSRWIAHRGSGETTLTVEFFTLASRLRQMARDADAFANIYAAGPK